MGKFTENEEEKKNSTHEKSFFERITTSEVVKAIFDYISKECPDATKDNDNSHQTLSTFFIYTIITFVTVSFACMAYLGYYSLDLYHNTNKGMTTFQKTPFVFIAIMFAVSLMFIDSLIKTLKYKTRIHEGMISLVIKNMGIFILVWYVLNKS